MYRYAADFKRVNVLEGLALYREIISADMAGGPGARLLPLTHTYPYLIGRLVSTLAPVK